MQYLYRKPFSIVIYGKFNSNYPVSFWFFCLVCEFSLICVSGASSYDIFRHVISTYIVGYLVLLYIKNIGSKRYPIFQLLFVRK